MYTAEQKGNMVKGECQVFTQWDVPEQPKQSAYVLVTCLAERKTDRGP